MNNPVKLPEAHGKCQKCGKVGHLQGVFQERGLTIFSLAFDFQLEMWQELIDHELVEPVFLCRNCL